MKEKEREGKKKARKSKTKQKTKKNQNAPVFRQAEVSHDRQHIVGDLAEFLRGVEIGHFSAVEDVVDVL